MQLNDIIVEIPIADGLCDFSENDLFMKGDEPYEFLESKDRIIKFRIPKIEAKEKGYIIVKLIVDQVDLNKAEETISQYVRVWNQNTEYISNDVKVKIEQLKANIVATQTTNRTEKKVKDGDNITFTIAIQNKGAIETDIAITDQVPYGLVINSAKLKTSEKVTEIAHDINLLVEHAFIKPNETIELEIDTTVDTNLMAEKEIENYVEIDGFDLHVQSNKVSFSFEVKSTENDKPSNDNKEEPSEGDNNQTSSNVYSISGKAWVDSNFNGMQDSEEKKISNMTVWLINEQNGLELSEKTKEDGSYSFQNVKKGNYIVVFQYDTNKYTVTAYQKEGVAQHVNSDVIHDVIKIQNQELPIAKTKTLEIDFQNLENIDAGFMEGKKFDLKIDKTIKQVTVQNHKGSKVSTYNQSQLAKVEIDAKQIANSNVIIEYNIAVTNQGEVAGYANEIIDYLPKDLSFNPESNPSWYQLKNGSLCTKELSNQIINPKETKNITLIVSKKMTQANMGTIINHVKIDKYSSDYGMEDIDTKNNESKAELIISIRTGRIILSISLTITITIMIAMGVYFIKKEVLQERR